MHTVSRFAAQLRRAAAVSRRAAVAGVVGLIAAAAVGGAQAQAQEPIKLGLLLTYVGPTASFAREEDRGARLLIEQVNKAGGINGRPIEVVQYNTEGKPDRAGSLYRRLAEEDKVTAVIGPDSIFVLLGMANVPSEVKVISVSAPGLYELLQPQFRGHVASAWAANSFSNALALGYLKDKQKVTRVGMITTADAVGDRMAKTAKAVAALFGVDVTIVAAQPASDRDLLPSLRKLAAHKPAIEALYVFGSGPFANIAMNQAELAGITVPIAYSGGNVIPELVKEISPATAKRIVMTTARGAVGKTLPKDDRFAAVVGKFQSEFEARYGEAPTLPAAVGYDMALTIVDAIKAVGTDREKVRDYIRTKQKLVGAQGVEFNRTAADGYGSNPAELVVATISNGQFVFAGYVKDSLDRLGVSQDKLRATMRELGLITE
jgi:branched-chain amino acid transport system substrate-binding protein